LIWFAPTRVILMTDKTKRQSKAESLRAAITAIAMAPTIDAAPANQSEAIAESPMRPAATQPTSVVTQPESISEPRSRPKPRAVKPVKTRPKPSQYYFYEEDRRAIRTLAAWLAGQGERPSDARVIRAVLQTARAGPDLLKAYRQTSHTDGRLRAHKTQQPYERTELREEVSPS
jgi:hypothetical protein